MKILELSHWGTNKITKIKTALFLSLVNGIALDPVQIHTCISPNEGCEHKFGANNLNFKFVDKMIEQSSFYCFHDPGGNVIMT